MLAVFDDVNRAKTFVTSLLESKLLPTAVEVLNRTALDLTSASGTTVPPGGLAVAVGQAGVSEEVARETKDIEALAKQEDASGLVILGAEDAASFWRTLGNNTLTRSTVNLKANYIFSGYRDFMDEAAAAEDGCAFSVSAGTGVTRVYCTDGDIEAAAGTGSRLRALAMEHQGALVMEAGPPDFKDSFDVWGPPRGDFALMKHLKTELDPQGVFNPGRFVGGL